ncbi:MAG TPA: hypothetical protein VMG35_08780, partial [Bryobacteraceae bacterium]|nr:hypothetical protein [Bryobacteraceae bacterium]
MAQSGRIQAAQRLIEGWNVAIFGVIREQRNYVAPRPEHIVGKALQGFLGADFHKHPGSGFVQRAQAFHELHRGRYLLCQDIQHLRHGVRPGG